MGFVVPSLVVVLAGLAVDPIPAVLDLLVCPVDPKFEFEADPMSADADFVLPIVDLVAECPMPDFVEFLDLPILEFEPLVFPMLEFEFLDLPILEFELLVFPMLEFELPESPKIEVVAPIEYFDLVDPID